MKRIREIILSCYIIYLNNFYKMNISSSARISLKSKLDKTNPKGIYIDDNTFIAAGVRILTHDYCRVKYANTIIGKNCFIGTDSIILPGVIIGDEVIVAAGSVVTRDCDSNSIYAGNPAKKIRDNVSLRRFGILNEKDYTTN